MDENENVIDLSEVKKIKDAEEEQRLRDLIDGCYGRWYAMHAKDDDDDSE